MYHVILWLPDLSIVIQVNYCFYFQTFSIIKFFGVCLQPPSLYLVFELATHGTLRNLLDSSARKRKRGLFFVLLFLKLPLHFAKLQGQGYRYVIGNIDI